MNTETRLIVPPFDEQPYPSLGFQVADFIEAYLCFGPGDLIGEPRTLSEEELLFIVRSYEVYPAGHALEGRRRFKRCVLSRRKGVAKTELFALIAIAECHPEGPVRFDGWDENGEPVGRAVVDPYIPMLAYTEEQVAELAFRAVYDIVENSKIVDDFVLTLEQISLAEGKGKIQPLANSPSARDGARTTFQHFDEPHLMVLPRVKEAHAKMLGNIPKRKRADAWSGYSSTMYGPGEESVMEDVHQYALAVARGEVKDTRLYFDHRQASEKWNLSRRAELVKAIVEASGPDAAKWADIDSIVSLYQDPAYGDPRFRRYWLNQRRRTAATWAIVPLFLDTCLPRRTVEDGTEIVLGFDGSYNRDCTILVGCTVEETPHLFLIRAWEKPLDNPGWRVPRRQVLDAVADAMERYRVLELAPDPPGWNVEIEGWEETYGEAVVRFETNQPRRMGPAVDDFEQACRDKKLTYDGHEIFGRHLGNGMIEDRRGNKVFVKEHPDSANKIDAAVCAIFAHHRAQWHYAHKQDVWDGAFVVDPSEGQTA